MLHVSARDVGFNSTHPLALTAWKAHAVSKAPQEACGLFLTPDEFVPLDNVHPEPENYFRISEKALLPYHGRIAGIVHSHTPNKEVDADDPNPAYITSIPTQADMEGQIASALPWAISLVSGGECGDPVWWGDQLPIRPLIGRTFIYGINDCLSLVRDWHRLQGITFPDMPRRWGWWESGKEELYLDNFEKFGFQRVIRPDGLPIPGDVFLCRLRASVSNHAGVYVGGGRVLQHTLDQLSKHMPASLWISKFEFLVRHKDLPDDRTEFVDAT